MQISRNLLSRLFRLAWRQRQGENFLTESLVFVSYFMLKDNPSVGRDFLNWLCWEGDEPQFVDGDRVSIKPWKTTEKQKRPDIRIEVPTKALVFVEVKDKHTSELTKEQVDCYRGSLKDAKAGNTKLITNLVLLTPKDDVDERTRGDAKHVKWRELAKWLNDNASSSAGHHVGEFLVDQFLDFLKRQGLSHQEIGARRTA